MDKSIVVEDCSSNDNNKKVNLAELFAKFMSKRGLKIVFLVLVGIVGLILLFGFDFKRDKVVNSDNVVSSTGYIGTIDYCKLIENKLIDVLSAVDGAGQVSVMITVDGSPELVYANEKDQTSSTNSSGSVTTATYSSPIIVNANGSSTALVMTEILPKVKGVIVVASGAGNVATKLDLLNAVSTLLDISTNQVTILKGV
jgi:stage III sporulation protein AG